MTIEIRDYYTSEIDAVRSLLFTNGFHHLSSSEVFQWQFYGFGEPIIKVAVDTMTGSVVGHYGLMPFPFFLGGRVYRGGKIEGSVLHEGYRSKSLSEKYPDMKGVRVFPLLISEMTGAIKECGLDFVFGFPNDLASKAQLACFRDFSFEAFDYVKILDGKKYLQCRFGLRDSAVVNLLSSAFHFIFDRSTHTNERKYRTEYPEELPDEVADLTRSGFLQNRLISADRSQRFMTWKYKDNPVKGYRYICTYDSRGNLAGYLVYSVNRKGSVSSAEISDIACVSGERDALKGLLVSCIRQLKREGAHIVSFFVNKSAKFHQMYRTMTNLGFIRRKTRQPAFLYTSEKLSQQSSYIYDSHNWYITSLFKQL